MGTSSKSPMHLLAALAVLLLLVGCGGDDDDSADDNGNDAITTTTPAPSDTATTPDGTDENPGGPADFCELSAGGTDQEDPAFFGSPEHVEQLREMAEVAPEAIAEDLDVLLEHLEQGVEPVDNGADILEGLPDDVADSVSRLVIYTLSTCD